MTDLIAAPVDRDEWCVEGIHLVGTRRGGRADRTGGSRSGFVETVVPDRLPVLLCLHGIGSSADGFATQMAGLGNHHRLVAWDAPGYARSADPSDALDLADYVERVRLVSAHLGQSVHLVGVSWGGVLALATALTRPSMLASLTLIGASRGSGRSAEAAAAMATRVTDLEAMGPVAFAQRRAPTLVSTSASPELVCQVADTMARAVRLPGYRWAAQTMAHTDLTDRLPEVDVPTLVLYGDDDRVTGAKEGKALAAAIPRSVTVSVAHAGHLVNQEQSEAVNAWIASFVQIVEGHPRPSPSGPPPGDRPA